MVTHTHTHTHTHTYTRTQTSTHILYENNFKKPDMLTDSKILLVVEIYLLRLGRIKTNIAMEMSFVFNSPHTNLFCEFDIGCNAGGHIIN